MTLAFTEFLGLIWHCQTIQTLFTEYPVSLAAGMIIASASVSSMFFSNPTPQFSFCGTSM
jgi:hypothetical protein